MKTVRCVRCHSDAVYKYGKTPNGHQRYICQICGKQFTNGVSRQEPKDRPRCPECGKKMHVYMVRDHYIRFRCSAYPACRTYLKVIREDSDSYELLCA
jgi:transposase-like protein